MKKMDQRPLVELSWHRLMRTICQVHRLLYAVGPPACGKSTFARRLAHELSKKRPLVLYCSPLTELTELFGQWRWDSEGMRFVDGKLPRALKQGRILICEEFASLPPEVKICFMALRGEQIITNPLNGEEIRIPGQFRCICLGNKEAVTCSRRADTMWALFSAMMFIEVPPLQRRDIEAFLQYRFPDAETELVGRVASLYEHFQQVSTNGQARENAGLSFRAAEQLMKLLRAGVAEIEATRIALVNGHIVDEDLHQAAQLKHSLACSTESDCLSIDKKDD
jgi:hypothetical protein